MQAHLRLDHPVVVVAHRTKSVIDQAISEMHIYGWEDAFGVDNPNYLPYWVKYMPSDERIQYLSACGHQFDDFTSNMLKSDFDWKTWSQTV